ncbi:MAG: hypothetical protein H0T60_02860 [Acidobacteria bacterium]|nr:hypothetical protein [Acidobacteriota bacterium]
MLSSYSSRLFPAALLLLLLLAAAFSLGTGAVAHAQERGDQSLLPAQLSSAAGDGATKERAADVTAGGGTAANGMPARRFHTSGARFVSAVSESAALRQGLNFDGPHAASPGADAFDAAEPAPRVPAWQDPQGSPTPSPTPAPLTPGQKMSRAFKRAFLSPMPYASSAFSATLTQIREDDQPHKTNGDKVADGLSRMAISFGRSATRTIFAAGIYASLFKQDPRYDRSKSKSFGGKALHAVSRVFVTRDDDGNIEPNYSRFAGVMTASALSNAWERSTPGHDRIGVDATFRRFARSFLNDAITNILFRELLPGIF